MRTKPGVYVVGGSKAITHEDIFGDGWIDRGDKLTVQGAYARQTWVRRCVGLRSKALAAVPHTISFGDEVMYDSEQQSLPEDLAFLGNFWTLLARIDASIALTARAYMLKRGIRGRRIDKLQWLAPMDVTIQADPKTGRLQFLRMGRTHPDSDIVHIFHEDAYKELGPGYSDGDAARVNADVLNSLNTHLDNYLDRGAIAATLVTVPRGTSKDEVVRLQRWWDQMFRGKSKSGNQKVIEAEGVVPVQIGEGLGDISSSEITEDQRKDIAAGFGVPFSLVDSTSPSNAVKRSDKLDLYDYTIKPQARIYEYELNKQVFNLFGMELKFHFDRLEVYQSIQLEKAQTVSTLTGAPVLSRNEGRIFLGLAELDDGKYDELLDVVADGFANIEEIGDPSSNNEQAEVIVPKSNPRDNELRQWRRKVKKKGPGVPFEAKYLTAEEAETIRLRLELGEELDSAFQAPFTVY